MVPKKLRAAALDVLRFLAFLPVRAGSGLRPAPGEGEGGKQRVNPTLLSCPLSI